MDPLKEYRTFQSTFLMSLRSTIRYYTPLGYLLTALLNPIFLIASAWVVVKIVAPSGGVPDVFGRTPYRDYLTFVILGFAFNGLMVAALDRGGGAVYEEQIQGTFELMELTPFTRFTWIFAKTFAAMFNSLLDLLLIVVLGGLLFGFHLVLAPQPLALAFLGVGLTIVALQGFGFLMAGLGIVWKQPQQVAVILSPVFILLSGMLFPLEVLPEPLQVAGRALPLTYGLNILRKALMLDIPPGALLPDVLGLVATGTVYMVVGFTLFTALEAKARNVGALATY